jgi:hypothetical protein
MKGVHKNQCNNIEWILVIVNQSFSSNYSDKTSVQSNAGRIVRRKGCGKKADLQIKSLPFRLRVGLYCSSWEES